MKHYGPSCIYVKQQFDVSFSSRFPNDSMLYDVDRQFMLGPALVVTPVLDEGATHVTGIFPKGRWFSVVHVSNLE